MAASRVRAAPLHGSPVAWSGERMAASPSTGMWSRTRRPKLNRKADDRCSATGSRPEYDSGDANAAKSGDRAFPLVSAPNSASSCEHVSSLGVPIEHFKIERSALRVHRVRDAYLEPLGSSASRSDLIETLNVACPTWKIESNAGGCQNRSWRAIP